MGAVSCRPLPDRFPQAWFIRITILKNSFIYIADNKDGFKLQWTKDREGDTDMCHIVVPPPPTTCLRPINNRCPSHDNHLINVNKTFLVARCYKSVTTSPAGSACSLRRVCNSGPCRAAGMSWMCSYCAGKPSERNKCKTLVSTPSLIINISPTFICQICLLQVHVHVQEFLCSPDLKKNWHYYFLKICKRLQHCVNSCCVSRHITARFYDRQLRIAGSFSQIRHSYDNIPVFSLSTDVYMPLLLLPTDVYMPLLLPLDCSCCCNWGWFHEQQWLGAKHVLIQMAAHGVKWIFCWINQ